MVTARLLLCMAFLLTVGTPAPIRAQSAPTKGVVWQVPDDAAQAERDLRRMKKMGVEAVRTGFVQRGRLLTLADTLGLQLYQELPVEYYSAQRLRDSLRYARQLLDRALQRAQGHPSARHFGLARRSETSDMSACAYYEQLAKQVRQRGPAGSQVYYLSAFLEQDRCAAAVDFVLLDALNEEPLRVVARWARSGAGATPAGIGALGARACPETGSGLRQPCSPESQARYFETSLRALLTDTAQVPSLFVYRWRDLASKRLRPAYGLEGAAQYSYGLVGPDGNKQPAFKVVQGFFTGRQTVFAFAAGTPPEQPLSWLTLLGWGVLFLMGVAYAASVQFRRMAARYFQASGFYREAVREGRGALVGVSVALLVALALAVGVMGSAGLHLISDQNAFLLLVQQLPAVLPDVLAALLTEPWRLALVWAGFYALGLLLWAMLLALLSRRYYALDSTQTLILVLWPRWLLVALMGAVLVVSTLSPRAEAFVALLGLVALWIALVLYATVRTLYDYARVARAPAWVPVAAGLLSPATVVGAGVLVAVLTNLPDAGFLWHLATRSL